MVCTFLGHSECYGLDKDVLRNAIENLIKQGTSEFLVGNHGQFDGMVFSCLQDLSKDYPEISYSVALKNIEGFFRGLKSKLAKKAPGSPQYRAQLRENSELIRDRLIREVMIRRTRGEVQQYYKDDLEKQGLRFPTAGSPEKIIYEFDARTDEAFTETIAAIKDFGYARYKPLLYLKDKKKFAKQLTAQHNMGGFMKGILIKRLESSFYAFSMTLSRFIESYSEFVERAYGIHPRLVMVGKEFDDDVIRAVMDYGRDVSVFANKKD